MESLYFKPIKPILQVTYPRLPPEQTEVDFRNSKQIDICELAAPEWDKPASSIDLEWVHAKRDLRAVTDYLKKTRAIAAIEYEKNNVKWSELQEKEENLQSSFIKFEQFVFENEDKRRRARRKIVDERLLQEERSKMLDDALDEQAGLIDVKQKLDQKTREFRIYEDFLNQVVTSDLLHYKSINDVINRYMVLMETKDLVSEKRARDMDELDHAKIQYGLLLDEKDMAVMLLNSQLVDLIVRHDRARSRALQWESIVTEIRDIIEQKHMELIGVKVSMWNMYKQMCSRKGEPKKHSKEDFEGQLVFIKKTLLELKKVRQIVEKLQAGKNYVGVKKRKGRHIKIQDNDRNRSSRGSRMPSRNEGGKERGGSTTRRNTQLASKSNMTKADSKNLPEGTTAGGSGEPSSPKSTSITVRVSGLISKSLVGTKTD